LDAAHHQQASSIRTDRAGGRRHAVQPAAPTWTAVDLPY
jgi:hypothetical protein